MTGAGRYYEQQIFLPEYLQVTRKEAEAVRPAYAVTTSSTAMKEGSTRDKVVHAGGRGCGI